MAFKRHTKEEALEIVKRLISAFENNIRHYKSDEYLEANCKSEFIDKFLMALNWDVNNDNEVAPKYREVIMEARANEKGIVKHPDYALCIGGHASFYVEAKPPSAKLLNDSSCAMQLKKYAFHMGKSLSVLTNFMELSVYDTRKKPDDKEEADKRRIKYITFDKYADEFDYIWNTFSYDAVIKGSLDTYFDKTDGNYYKNDTDDEILDAIDEWRGIFIKSIHAKGGKITDDNVNMAVQRLINRIVYIWRTKGY